MCGIERVPQIKTLTPKPKLLFILMAQRGALASPSSGEAITSLSSEPLPVNVKDTKDGSPKVLQVGRVAKIQRVYIHIYIYIYIYTHLSLNSMYIKCFA